MKNNQKLKEGKILGVLLCLMILLIAWSRITGTTIIFIDLKPQLPNNQIQNTVYYLVFCGLVTGFFIWASVRYSQRMNGEFHGVQKNQKNQDIVQEESSKK